MIDPDDTNIQVSPRKNLDKWQQNLLPLMKRMIIGLSLFFFLASFSQLIYLHLKILRPSDQNVSNSVTGLSDTKDFSFSQRMEASRQQALVLLEDNALQRRHHQANVLLMSRIWVKYLGFVTGMILAFVGAVFILGKLEESRSEVATKTSSFELSFSSASPGIILTILGSLLMITTIFTNPVIEVNDKAVFLQNLGTGASTTSDETKPVLNLNSKSDTLSK